MSCGVWFCFDAQHEPSFSAGSCCCGLMLPVSIFLAYLSGQPFKSTGKLLLGLTKHQQLMENESWIRESIMLRNTYVDPLHLLQVELLHRQRSQSEQLSPPIKRALMVTIAGIAAGMRNSG